MDVWKNTFDFSVQVYPPQEFKPVIQVVVKRQVRRWKWIPFIYRTITETIELPGVAVEKPLPAGQITSIYYETTFDELDK